MSKHSATASGPKSPEVSKSELVSGPEAALTTSLPSPLPTGQRVDWRLQLGGFLAFQQYYTRGIIYI